MWGRTPVLGYVGGDRVLGTSPRDIQRSASKNNCYQDDFGISESFLPQYPHQRPAKSLLRTKGFGCKTEALAAFSTDNLPG